MAIHPYRIFKDLESRVGETKSIPESSSANSRPSSPCSSFHPSRLPLSLVAYHWSLPWQPAAARAGSLYRSRGGALEEGAGEEEPEEVSAASSWLLLSSPHPPRGRRPSGDAAASAAATADTPVRLEGWFLFAPSPTREWGKKIPAAAADVGFGGCVRLGHKENGFSLHLSLLSTASPGLSKVSSRERGYLLGLAGY